MLCPLVLNRMRSPVFAFRALAPTGRCPRLPARGLRRLHGLAPYPQPAQHGSQTQHEPWPVDGLWQRAMRTAQVMGHQWAVGRHWSSRQKPQLRRAFPGTAQMQALAWPHAPLPFIWGRARCPLQQHQTQPGALCPMGRWCSGCLASRAGPVACVCVCAVAAVCSRV